MILSEAAKTITRRISLAGLMMLLTGLMLMPAEQAQAQRSDGNLGIGLIAGEPTGLSAKLWAGGNNAFAGGLAWSFSGDNQMHIHLDYLYHNFGLFNVDQGSMALHYGIGGRLQLQEDDDSKLGVRFPVGLSYLLANNPLELFVEIVPVLDLAPDSEFSANGGIGIRYYF